MKDEIPEGILKQFENDADEWALRMESAMNSLTELDMYLLRIHTLLEHELNELIEIRTHRRLSMKKANFNFSTKIKLLKLLGFFEHEDHIGKRMEDFVSTLNEVRNQIAHSLIYKRSSLKVLLDIENLVCLGAEKKTPPKGAFGVNMIDYSVSYYIGRMKSICDSFVLHEVFNYLQHANAEQKRVVTSLLKC